MATKEPTVTQWVCQCCYVALVNGEECYCGNADNEQHPSELMSELADYEPTPGTLEHAEGCEREDCDCEDIPFSHSQCDGCGSHLYGERHAVTGWI